MDDVDRQLLTTLQSDIPLRTKPFDAIAKKIQADAAEVLFRIQRLKSENLIRHFGGIFDPKALGHKIALAAMRLEPSEVDRLAEIVNAHPGVLQSSQRPHELNFWFQVAVGPNDGLEDHMRKLAELAGAQKTLILPVLRSFKPGPEDWVNSRAAEQALSLNSLERNAVRRLQQDFPLTDEPFLKMASELGISEPVLFQMIQAFRDRGLLRRMGALFPDPDASRIFESWNVWQIPEEKLEAVGNQVAEFPGVVSCTKRPHDPDFPYSLFVVMKTRRASEMNELIRHLEKHIGAWPHQVLPAVRVYKRAELKFFSPELEAWNREKGLCLVGSE